MGGDGANPFDLFPGLSEEIDRRIAYSEQRIKNWVLGGIIANVLVVAGAAIPMVFYLGQMSRDGAQALATIQVQQSQLATIQNDVQKRIIWETTAEQWMVSKGFSPPRDNR